MSDGEAEQKPGEHRAGSVTLVGAGPGDPDLITVRGVAALAQADVVLYDELASDELLSLAPTYALRINVGKRAHTEPTVSQPDIQDLMIRHAVAGKQVVRLKGGDPFVFGRGGEEISACSEAGVPYEVVPGVSSAIAALAYAGIPVTDRRHSASFAVVTGHKDPTRVSRATRWAELGAAVDTLVILMGMKNLRQLVSTLLDGGKPADTPAAAVMNGTRPDQRVVVSALAELPDRVEAAGLGSPAAVVVGDVVRLREEYSWWERRPLFGMRALVTRSMQQAGGLASALRSAGAIPVCVPLIELLPPESPDELAAITEALAELTRYDAILFNSSNAVRHFVDHAQRLGEGQKLDRLAARIWCIGRKTARAAFDAGLGVHFVASSDGDAESVLGELTRTLRVDGLRILVPRSDIGRNVLPEGLRAAGARVDAIQIYRNVRPPVDEESLRADLVAGRLPILTFTSPSTAQSFAALLDAPAHAAAGRSIIAAIGATTGRALEKVGLPPDVVPRHPDVRELVSDLSSHVSGLRMAIGG